MGGLLGSRVSILMWLLLASMICGGSLTIYTFKVKDLKFHGSLCLLKHSLIQMKSYLC
jgi:hypothetical protein